jgi:aryl-alcohol dehydrogenase-like predicted oxidoreductase
VRYHTFGRHTGLRVSEIVLGAGLFGTRWGYGTEPADAKAVLDRYLEAGGNFIDTADTYQLGQSEELLGEFLGGRRDEVVLATKFSFGGTAGAGLLSTGNSRMVMNRSVEASLRRLKTDRVDLLWVHIPDGVTPSEEIVRGLDDLARAGKIVYAGLSDFPAWRVTRAVTIAELSGLVPVVGMQMEYSLVQRTPDRELLPAAQALGLGMVGWSPLGGGLLTGKYRRGEQGRAETFQRLIHREDDKQKGAVLDTLEAVASELGVNPGQVAIAWIATRGVLPIIGPRTLAQLDDNLGASGVRIDAEQLLRLNSASAPSLGFPHDLLADGDNRQRLAGGKLESVIFPPVPVA